MNRPVKTINEIVNGKARRSKGDQEAHGDTRGLPYGRRAATCPVRAWRAWLDASGITE
jgi:hypothetical protein